MTNKVLFLLPVALFIFSAACKKKGNDGPTGPQGPTGPSGPVFYGAIAGHVLVYDQYGNIQTNNLDGITVRLNDKSSAVTDASGYYVLDSVVTGNYNLSVSKTSLGSTMANNTIFLKDTLIRDIKMTMRPDFDILGFKVYQKNGLDSLVATFQQSKKVRSCILFASDRPSVSGSDYLLMRTMKLDTFTWANPAQLKITSDEFTAAGIAHGQTVYFAAYSYAVKDFSAYEDRVTGKMIYTAIGNPLIDSAIAP